jgi:hypothetical protein
MPQPVFGDDFSSEMLPGNKAIQVTTGDGSTQVTMNLRSLSKRLQDGAKVDQVDLAVAGVAISHLLALRAISKKV